MHTVKMQIGQSVAKILIFNLDEIPLGEFVDQVLKEWSVKFDLTKVDFSLDASDWRLEPVHTIEAETPGCVPRDGNWWLIPLEGALVMIDGVTAGEAAAT